MTMVRRWLRRAPVLVLAALVLTPVAPAKEKAEAVRIKEIEDRMRKDVSHLASDELEGRGIPTRGLDRAADYIADEFKKAGLKPGGLGGSYFQPFTIKGARLTAPASLSLRGPQGQTVELKSGTHFEPMGLSHSGSIIDRPLVFVGHGIIADKVGYDDFADVDVGGKVVVVLRDRPTAGNRFVSLENPTKDREHGSIQQKMVNAEKQGALAVLLVNDDDTARTGDDLVNFGFTAVFRGGEPPRLPILHLRRGVLDSLLHSTGNDLETLEGRIKRDRTPASVALKGWTASLDVKVKRDGLDTKNVVGVLEGKGPLANETVVIGAHYDHLGYGGYSSLSGSKKMAIHNGADDNASGTAAVMELARRFAALPGREGRRLVFMAFSGEELGLNGSVHYCKSPLFPLADTAAMLNLDMVGRLAKDAKTGKEKLEIGGTGTAKAFEEMIDRVNKRYDFQISKVKSGFGPSDHSSFYEKKIPVLFFFTGIHADYHRPTDDWDKINYDGMRRVTDMAEEMSAYLATIDPRPEYVKTSGGATGIPRPKLSLGIRPGDYSGDDGILVGGVTEGRPAAKAGIKEGDLIVEMGGKPIKNMEAYMVFLNAQKENDVIDVTVLRDKEKKVVKVKLEP